ncbi:ankyrin repeat, SAM and basic leucine zipper domain-containing protein 1-like isoform X11 [Haliotis rubra]|uniref:ankyrin repeat, SAM and basic leucine zipper domain-containing protein 1-like isoform X11 n=1 Tax=Haliotis rubra TaxID=36100 RepID=UPI001EE5655D|nr:ankyrin repeat, SAM and basic leucine zipper domain-containing protein 1-like isoform X11 [Haliotis rubra]
MWIYGSIVFLCCLTVQGEEECEPGQYGDGCSKSCSRNCKPLPNGIVRCHKETGECFEGCEAGVYGDQCDEPCSKHCLGNTCNMHNGHCALGCIENHIGVFCEIYNGITIVHQGTTSSSHTTVTTGVVPTSSSQVVIPVVVAILVLILVGVVVIFIWHRKKEESQRDPDVEVGFLPATPTPARRDARADDDLHVACREGNLAEVKRILDTGRADVNCRSVDGMTPVMWAALGGHRDVVELLVSRGADVSLVDDNGDNILHCACMVGDRKTVEFVLSLDVVDINSRGWRSNTPVMEAAEGGHRDVVELLVSRGADVSLVDDDGNNILHCACMVGDRKTVEFVLSQDGVDINVRNNDGETAADVARDRGHHQLWDFLVSHGTHTVK